MYKPWHIPTHFSATSPTKLSDNLGFHSFVLILRICDLADREGRGNRNSRSNLPGRLRAGSMESILLVAPITTISPRLSKPSIRASSVETIELCIWSCRLERTGARPSISSKNMIDGLDWYACNMRGINLSYCQKFIKVHIERIQHYIQ